MEILETLVLYVMEYWIVVVTLGVIGGGWGGIKMMERIGKNPILGLLFLIPYVNGIVILWLAYAHWPALEQEKTSKSEAT